MSGRGDGLLDDALDQVEAMGGLEGVSREDAVAVARGWLSAGLSLRSPHDPGSGMDLGRAILVLLYAGPEARVAREAGADPAWLGQWAADGLLAVRDETPEPEDLAPWTALGASAGRWAGAGLSPGEAAVLAASQDPPGADQLAVMAALRLPG